MTISRVRAGDLITAEGWNDLCAELLSMKARLDALEAAQAAGQRAPVISALLPSNELRVGQQIRIVGFNFAEPADSNVVTIAGTRIFGFSASSSSTQLVFGVPNVVFSGARFDTTLSVQTTYGSASVPFTILPAQVIPTGRVTVASDAANAGLGTATPGARLVWAFNVTSETNVAETYRVSAVIINQSGAISRDVWAAALSVLGPSGAPVTAPIPLAVLEPSRVSVALTVPTGATAADSVRFALRVESVNNPSLTSNSSSVDVTTGQRPQAPGGDSRVTWVSMTPLAPTAANPARRVVDAMTGVEFVEIPFGQAALVEVRATFAAAGDYSHAVSIDQGGGGVWEIVSPPPVASLGRAVGQNVVIGTVLRLNAAATPGTHSEQAVMTVRTRRTLAGADTFDSWATLFIRGYTP